MKRLYVRDEDWADHVDKKLRIIRGTDELVGTLKGQDAEPSPLKSGELTKAWVLDTDGGALHRFVPSDDWDIYEDESQHPRLDGSSSD